MQKVYMSHAFNVHNSRQSAQECQEYFAQFNFTSVGHGYYEGSTVIG